MTVTYMTDPPCRRSTPEYHAAVCVRELPSCKPLTIAGGFPLLLHPEAAERVAKALNEGILLP